MGYHPAGDGGGIDGVVVVAVALDVVAAAAVAVLDVVAAALILPAAVANVVVPVALDVVAIWKPAPDTGAEIAHDWISSCHAAPLLAYVPAFGVHSPVD